MKQVLQEILTQVVKTEFGLDLNAIKGVVWSHPPKIEMGDYACNVALVLSKELKKSPRDIAEGLALSVERLVDSRIQKVEAVGGFLNFTLNCDIWAVEVLTEIGKLSMQYGKSNLGENRRIVIDYFQNNVAKPPHVGHLRSAVIGDALKRIFSYLGYNVLSDTHIGDWGVQFGILLYAFKTLGNRSEVEKDPILELNKLYVLMSAQIDEKPELRELCKQEFVKLEQGDPENRQLWQWFVSESLKDFEKYRRLLNLLPFEYNLGESFYEDKMQAVLDEFTEKGLVMKGETGELYVDLENVNLGRCILVKSDGGTTYHLRDFATFKYRRDVIGFWKNIYVVDVRQSHHFEQLFAVLERAGYEHAKQENIHVFFGFMSLPEGAISTRKGNVISLEALVFESYKRALEIIEAKNSGLANKSDVAGKVSLAAIKFFDLSHNPASNITFTWDKVLSFEGFTGPYCLYTYARAKSILRISNFKDQISNLKTSPKGEMTEEEEELETFGLISPEERVLVRQLEEFPEIVKRSAEEYNPAVIATFVFETCQAFNTFYTKHQVLKAENEQIKNARLHLVSAVAQVIQNGLVLLGIETVEEM